MASENPSKLPIDAGLLHALFGRRDELVRAITAGMASGEWDQVMGPFDDLLAAIKQLEESIRTEPQQGT